ncbi:hypothetical protein FQA39_LY01155 [Lamprigera yunnana]|nr:hypothetical protein FQA39_LY01155 [Lamprigera yunnana]
MVGINCEKIDISGDMSNVDEEVEPDILPESVIQYENDEDYNDENNENVFDGSSSEDEVLSKRARHRN